MKKGDFVRKTVLLECAYSEIIEDIAVLNEELETIKTANNKSQKNIKKYKRKIKKVRNTPAGIWVRGIAKIKRLIRKVVKRKSLSTKIPVTKEDPYDTVYENNNSNNDLLELVKLLPNSNGSKAFKGFDVNIGMIADEFSFKSFVNEANVTNISPHNWEDKIKSIDVLLVISCWEGVDGEWTGVGAVGSGERKLLHTIIAGAKDNGIPAIFYSIEDPPHYERYVDIAKECDYIFTSATEMTEKYKADCHTENVYPLSFAVNIRINNPIGCKIKKNSDEVIFAGAYYSDYEQRVLDMEMIFDGILDSGKLLRIIDRNYHKSKIKQRFPIKYCKSIYPPIQWDTLQKVHKLYDWSVSLNSITDSATMFAMRAYELSACGTLLLSNYSRGLNELLPHVHIVNNREETEKILGAYSDDEIYERQMWGVRSIMSGNTANDRMKEILATIGIPYTDDSIRAGIVCEAENAAIQQCFSRQTLDNAELIDIKDFNEDTYNRYDVIAFWDKNMEYGEFYLEDMVNAFKYTSCDYITKDSYLSGDSIVSGIEHNYVSKMGSKFRSVFWRESFPFNEINELQENADIKNGYSIDHFNYNVRNDLCETAGESDYKLSVIVATRNNGVQLFNKAFSSLIRSSIFEDMEIVLVDYGSSDENTIRIIKYIEQQYPNVKSYFFKTEDRDSLSQARSKGVELATSEYITYLNPEDEAVGNGYAHLYKEALKKQFDVVFGYAQTKGDIPIDYSTKSTAVKIFSNDFYDLTKHDFLKKIMFRCPDVSSMIVKKSRILNNTFQGMVSAEEEQLFSLNIFLTPGVIKVVDIPISMGYKSALPDKTCILDMDFLNKQLWLAQERKALLNKHCALKDFVNGGWVESVTENIFGQLCSVQDRDIEKVALKVYEILDVCYDEYDGDDPLIHEYMKLCYEGKFEDALVRAAKG